MPNIDCQKTVGGSEARIAISLYIMYVSGAALQSSIHGVASRQNTIDIF